jgi:hypothetical protein
MMKRWIPLALLAAACGGRPDHWDAPVDSVDSVSLSGSAALLDRPLDRVVMLTSPGDGQLATRAIPVGKKIVKAEASRDRQTLFVLANGVQPRRSPDDERPSLSVIAGGTDPRLLARYELTDPLTGLAVDPEGKWAVVYDAGGVVVNPNELIFVDLSDPKSTPYSKTIRSFGGRPERLTFTAELSVPNGGPRRFVIVETQQDVTLIDLSDLTRDEVTIRMPETAGKRIGMPAEVAYHDGDPADLADARIAVRFSNDTNVLLAELGQPAPGEIKPFQITVNLADVGAVPSAIDFVQTDGGLRLAALVPDLRRAALLDPSTTVIETIQFGQRYDRMTRVTKDVAVTTQSDIALLWSGSTGIAFWSLGKTSGTPFRSVDAYEIGISVGAVKNVPGEKFSHLKILESQSSTEFYVLDLNKRQSFPMIANAAGFTVTVSPDGERAWALRPASAELASIRLSDLHPTSVVA